MPLGRFLEVSIAAADVAESLAFYESLGFVQAIVGEAWPHAYAVVTDGRLCLGLHAQEPEAPLLTWVAPGLRARLDQLAPLGIEPESVSLDDLSLHQALLRSPSGQRLRLLEARTFSPPVLAPSHATRLGYFDEFAWPANAGEFAEATSFWEPLGFVAFEPVAEPFDKVVASSRDLNIALYDLDLQTPVLVFSAAGMAARIIELRERGYRFAQRLPRALDALGAALLEAPEGTALLLLDEAAASE
jgi:catechol 2,3-dioxygenase-like lactoylglutathione lyase family enzyme